MSFFAKYYGKPNDGNGNPLSWPGSVDGYPFRGRMPGPLKQEEYEQLPLEFDFHTELLTLPDQLERYEKIKDAIANSLWLQCNEKFIELEKSDKPRVGVMLSWIEPYAKAPLPKTPGRPDPNSFFGGV